MLILLIKSHCKIYPLPTIRSRVFVLLTIDGNGYILQWELMSKMELGQKVGLYIHVVVLLRGLPSLDGILERFVIKKCKKRLPNSSQKDYRYREENDIPGPELQKGKPFMCL